MFRVILLTAFAMTLAAGCNDSRDVKAPPTSSASPPIELPADLKIPDAKGDGKQEQKPAPDDKGK